MKKVRGTACAVLLAITVPAWGIGRERIGTTGAPFLKVGVSPRLAALGEAYGALGDDWGTIQANPAGLYYIDRKEAAFVHANLVADIDLNSLYYVHPLPGPWGALGVNYVNLGFGDIERTVLVAPGGGLLPFARAGTFSARDQSLSIGYADDLRLGKRRFLWGLSGKIIHQKIAEESASGFAVDLGLRYDPPDRPYRLGVALQNLGFLSKFRDEADDLPLNLKFSGAVSFFGGRLALGSDLNLPIDNVPILTFGLEVRPVQFLALRGGYRFDDNTTDFKGPSAGVGIRWGSFRFDYAYVPFEVLGTNHRFGVGFAFGAAKSEEEESSGPQPLPERHSRLEGRHSRLERREVEVRRAPERREVPQAPKVRPYERKVSPYARKTSAEAEPVVPVAPAEAFGTGAGAFGTGAGAFGTGAEAFGPKPVSGGVLFRYVNPSARSVSLVGDFNGWDGEATPMRRGEGGVFFVRVALAPGTYRYQFLVDGARVVDPYAPARVSGGPAGTLGVLEVR